MRALVGLIVLLATNAFAQSAQPNGAGKQAKAKAQAPAGCKFVGTVKGTKLWAGDCTDAAGLRGSDATSLLDQAGSAILPGQKE